MEENNQVWVTVSTVYSKVVDLITLTEFATGTYIKMIIDLNNSVSLNSVVILSIQ